MIAILTLATSLSAFSNVESTTGNTGSPLATETPTNLSDTSAIYKQAVFNGREAAVDVIGGEQPSNLFDSAKVAATMLTGEEFESDLEAAIVIIELSQE
tara:strand:+ start:30379 stop:30675 length:297 start_codon:yes stop_codon:yes gene_type:complete